ncbi:cation:proton antiporter domain-containing protein [Streptomyces sp. NPDC054884]
MRNGLNVESGLNDGLALPFFLMFLAAIPGTIASEEGVGGVFWRALVVSTAVGLAFGRVGGWLLTLARARARVTGDWQQVMVLAVAFAAYSVATAADGSGFIATWMGGFAFGVALRKGEAAVVKPTPGKPTAGNPTDGKPGKERPADLALRPARPAREPSPRAEIPEMRNTSSRSRLEVARSAEQGPAVRGRTALREPPCRAMQAGPAPTRQRPVCPKARRKPLSRRSFSSPHPLPAEHTQEAIRHVHCF